MKIRMMLALTIFLISTSGFSITGRDNWQTIRASREVIIQQPTFAGAFGPQGLFNACATEEEFKSKLPVSTCLSYRQVFTDSKTGPYKDYACNDFETRNVSISRTFTQEECVRHNQNGECVEYDNVTSVYPTSFQLVVIEAGGEQAGHLIFTKSYGIPPCD